MAKLTIAKEHLITLLDTCSLAVSRRDEDDITNNFHFQVDDGVLTLSATDKISISRIQSENIEADEDSFAFTLKATKIQGLLSTLKKADTIELEFNPQDMNVILNGKYDLPSREPNSFPSFDSDLENSKEISAINVDKFTDSLTYIKGFIGADTASRPELTAAPMLKDKFIASNGGTLGIYESDIFKEEGFEVTFNTIVNIQRFAKQAGQRQVDLQEIEAQDSKTPTKTIEDDSSNNVDLSEIIEESAKEAQTAVIITPPEERVIKSSIEPEVVLLKSDNYFILASKDKTMYYGYRKSDYKFPKKMLERHLEESYDDSFRIPRTELLDTITRLSYCLNENSARMSFTITGSEAEAKLIISVLGSHNRVSQEEINIKRSGDCEEDLDFDLTYLHLIRILPLYASPELFVGVKKDRNIRLVDEMDTTVKLSGVVSFIRKR